MANNDMVVTGDWAVLGVMSHPARREILRLCWAQARSVGELAEMMHLNPGTVLHHVRRLAAVHLLALEGTERKRGVTEKRYRSAGRMVNFQPPVDEVTAGALAPLVHMVQRDVAGIDPHPAAERRALLVAHVAEPRLGVAQQQEVARRLAELARWVESLPPEAEGVPMRLSAMFGPRGE